MVSWSWNAVVKWFLKLSAATSNRTVLLHTHNSCFTARCVRGQNNFKIYLATTVARPHPPDYWGAMRGAIYKKSSHSPWNEGRHCKFHLAHLSYWIVTCPYKQMKTCRSVPTSACGQFPTFALTCINVQGILAHHVDLAEGQVGGETVTGRTEQWGGIKLGVTTWFRKRDQWKLLYPVSPWSPDPKIEH
jgi:hypothetical protein